MAKNKEQPIEPIEEVKAVEAKEHVSFVDRKLKVINEMTKPAKAQRLAHRLLMKARNN